MYIVSLSADLADDPNPFRGTHCSRHLFTYEHKSLYAKQCTIKLIKKVFIFGAYGVGIECLA